MITDLPVRIAQSAMLPLTFQEVVGSLRTRATEQSKEGQEILRLMAAARDRVETYTHLQLLEADYELTLDSWWKGDLIIPTVPFSNKESVKLSYYDAAGELQLLAESSIRVKRMSQKQGVVRIKDVDLPQTSEIVLSYKAGYASVEEIPGDLIDAMYVIIQERYANRADTPDDKTRVSETLMDPHVWPVIA